MNTTDGLKPMYDEDFDEKKKLKIGETYKADITKARNLKLHKKYFALLNCTWEYFNETQLEFFNNSKELFRSTVQMAAGYSKPLYSIKYGWIEEPKSIKFERMDEYEFRELYERSKDVIYNTFLKSVSIEEFERNLIHF